MCIGMRPSFSQPSFACLCLPAFACRPSLCACERGGREERVEIIDRVRKGGGKEGREGGGEGRGGGDPDIDFSFPFVFRRWCHCHFYSVQCVQSDQPTSASHTQFQGRERGRRGTGQQVVSSNLCVKRKEEKGSLIRFIRMWESLEEGEIFSFYVVV